MEQGMQTIMQAILNVALVGVGVLFFGAAASAQPCVIAKDITLNGKITKRENQAFAMGPRINLYVADASLSCSPVKVMTTPDSKCKVGANLKLDGSLAKDPDGSWELMGGPYGFQSKQIECSK
jgi:hypothetical protein